jgi:hypothetical protein
MRAALMRPAAARLARNVVGGAVLGVPAVARKVVGSITGIGFAYRRPPGAHPLVGTRAADIALAGGSARLYEALRAGTFVLVVPDGVDVPARDRITVVRPADPRHPALLVRPDADLAWAADHADTANIATALDNWLSAATVAH